MRITREMHQMVDVTHERLLDMVKRITVGKEESVREPVVDLFIHLDSLLHSYMVPHFKCSFIPHN